MRCRHAGKYGTPLPVLVVILREMEKYGKCSVDLFVIGKYGGTDGRSANSDFGSETVRVSKHKSTHPASLSYRFNDSNHKDCTLRFPAFSKLLS